MVEISSPLGGLQTRSAVLFLISLWVNKNYIIFFLMNSIFTYCVLFKLADKLIYSMSNDAYFMEKVCFNLKCALLHLKLPNTIFNLYEIRLRFKRSKSFWYM